MCGIVGYLGRQRPTHLLVDSLSQLEYRGYDSAGVALADSQSTTVDIVKATGKLVNLKHALPSHLTEVKEPNGTWHRGIGHIRWATHGAPTEANAHPHVSESGRIALVHNGIIENFAEIRERLTAQGVTFHSETDTECIAQLLGKLLDSQLPFTEILRQLVAELQGAYALTIINADEPEKLYALRSHAPLVLGHTVTTPGQNEWMVASDTVALAAYTEKVLYLQDGQIAELSPEGLTLYDAEGDTVLPRFEQLATGPLAIDKKGYKHFMLKEIHEQPDVVRNSLSGRLSSSSDPITLESYNPSQDSVPPNVADLLKDVNRVVVLGCGTSFNAGLVGKYFIEDLVRLPVEVEAAGEYRYRKPVLDEQTLVIAISQSGETADTLEAVRQAKESGARTLTLTNREDSSLAREVEVVLPVRAGVEVSVCATKSFSAQVVVLYLLGLYLAEHRQTASSELIQQLKEELLRLPILMEAYLSDTTPLRPIARQYGMANNMLFIGRGINYPVALEGALKLKEISYIHAEGYSGAELKHGPIALLDSKMPVVSVMADGPVFEKIVSNIQEANARDARLIGFSNSGEDKLLNSLFETWQRLPKTHELLSPLITTLPLQLLSYYMAEYLGKDVDQPRNLAKSVTVE